MIFDISIYASLNLGVSSSFKLVKPENRYSEIEEFLYYADKVGFYLSEEQDLLISKWVEYVNCECESYSWYSTVKDSIISKWGEEFFTEILFNHGYLLKRTKRRNDLISSGKTDKN